MAKKGKRTILGRELAKLRIDHDEESRFMASRLGVSPSALSNWEYGRSAPSMDLALTIKKEYGVDLTEEVKATARSSNMSIPHAQFLTPAEMDLVTGVIDACQKRSDGEDVGCTVSLVTTVDSSPSQGATLDEVVEIADETPAPTLVRSPGTSGGSAPPVPGAGFVDPEEANEIEALEKPSKTEEVNLDDIDLEALDLDGIEELAS